MAIAIPLPEFNDLGSSVTSVSLLMDHFLCRFYTLCEKMKKIYRLGKMHHRIPFFLALRLSVWRFQMPLEGLSLATLATFGFIYATDPPLQSMTKIVCLC